MGRSLPRLIKLMPDYDCHPLWNLDGEPGPIDPTSLPISRELCADLARWAGVYDGTLDRASPADSGFRDAGSLARFTQESERLWKALQAELGDETLVVYVSCDNYAELAESARPPPRPAQKRLWYVFVYDREYDEVVESYYEHDPGQGETQDVSHGPIEAGTRDVWKEELKERFADERYHVQQMRSPSLESAVDHYRESRKAGWYVFVYEDRTHNVIRSYYEEAPGRTPPDDTSHGGFPAGRRMEVVHELKRRFPPPRYGVGAVESSNLAFGVQYYLVGSEQDLDHFFDGSD